jgi:phospholipid/cholesterol/gamma-HCH transport system substrate-binding protein
MKNTLESRLGIFVALAVIAAVLILEIVGGIERFQPGYRLHGLFDNIQELKVGDRVKMAGVEVGRVEEVSLDQTNNKVRVTMKLRRKVAVRTDSIASIRFTGLMGQNFIAIEFGSPTAPLLTDNQDITTEETRDLNAMVQKLDKVAENVQKMTASFTGDKIDNFLGPLTDFMKNSKDPLTTTISNLEVISTQIKDGKGTVGKLIFEDTLHNTALTTVSNVNDTISEVKVAVADARKVVDQVNAGEGTVGKLVKDETLYRQLTAAMTNVNQILVKVNQGTGSVSKLINDPDLYKNAKMTLQKLDKATEGLEDQGPLSVMGILINNLF